MVFSNNLLMGAGGQASSAYEIDQSIRFESGDDALLSRSLSSSGSLTTWTLSCWLKRGRPNANENGQWFPIWSASDGSSTSDYPLSITDSSTPGFWAIAIGGQNWTTSQRVGDVAAWYHAVVVWDSTNGTAGDRMRLYINGSRVTSFSATGTVSSSMSSRWNSSSYSHHRIGSLNISAGPDNKYLFDGYLAEMVFLDGTATTDASSFGEYDSNGVWIPKDVSGLTFGSNGFFIDGRDSSDLGDDESGNGNDFSSSGLTAADQMPDTPTLNHWTLNPLDSGGTLANGNLQNKGGSSTNTHAPAFPKTGKWYVEIDCTDINTGTSGAHFFGICDASVPYSASFSDHAATSAGQQRGGQLKKDNSNTSSGTAVNDGDVIALAFDADNLTLDLYVNNSASGSQITSLTDVQYKLWIQDGGTVTNMQFNFAEASLEYTPPTGFKALSTANLSTPTIKDGSKYFNTALYTGNSGTAFSVTGVGFKPDWLWAKPRSLSDNHRLQDIVRGSTTQLISNSNGAEFTQSQGITSFDSDGFTVGTHNGLNNGTNTYVAWNWLAGNTTGSSNTDGDITSTVTANTTSGFSIVTYSGNGSDNQEIGHGLGIAPKMIITKRRDASGNWTTYHDAVGINQVFYLNSTAVPASNTEQYRATPTSSVYTIGVGGDINNSSGTYVAYVFAEVEGYSSIGSYEGNGNADGSFIFTGFSPSWLLIKNIDATESWNLRDNKRDLFNVTKEILVPNTNAAESTSGGGQYADLLSNGFKLRGTDPGVNSSATFIYMAFAENPFGGDGAAPVTAR